jgi:hypothetical protein
VSRLRNVLPVSVVHEARLFTAGLMLRYRHRQGLFSTRSAPGANGLPRLELE